MERQILPQFAQTEPELSNAQKKRVRAARKRSNLKKRNNNNNSGSPQIAPMRESSIPRDGPPVQSNRHRSREPRVRTRTRLNDNNSSTRPSNKADGPGLAPRAGNMRDDASHSRANRTVAPPAQVSLHFFVFLYFFFSFLDPF